MLVIWLVLGLCSPATSLPAQVVLDEPQPHPLHTGDRGLHGRFLHITDVHPDPFYKHGAHPSTACHRKKPKKKRRAGYYGTAYKECDSPLALTNFTLDYLEERWSDEIDFVIWTGDSARHDNDDEIPRPLSEVYELNEAVAEKMKQIFSSKGIPVVPTIGNNDVWPHVRAFTAAHFDHMETRVLRFRRMWSDFIPPESRASFLQGGYFSIEVVPGALAVVSLNTMYFYSSNEGVDGCPMSDDDDPGNQQFTWFEDQLKMFRSRQLQVWVIGHVPPTDGHYYSQCYGRYVELSLRFQDTILGHLFGHLNTDHVQ
ncbi:Metallo-dependent phosphatase-like protein [Pisolithus sp. B1]|nr:Metallo-dependent phosphatase-like protein [Pisolithus sp. B1]